MSTDHSRRIWKLCDDTLRQAALGEPYGLFVEFCFAPEIVNGQVAGFKPAWMVCVTIRNSGLGLPDIGNGAPVFGLVPPDELFRQAATALLELDRKQREEGNASALLGKQREAALNAASNGRGA